MKKSLLYALVLISFSFNELTAQASTPEKYRSVFVGIGPRILDATPGVINTYYVDSSPAQDDISSLTEVAESYTNLGFQIGYKFGKYNGLSHNILVDLSLGEHSGGLVTYSLGYNFVLKQGENPSLLRASLFTGFGNYGFDVGQLENNTGFIEINDIQFTDAELDVDLNSQFFVYGPQIDFSYAINDKFDIFFSANYDIASDNSRPTIDFTSETGSSTSIDLEEGQLNPSITFEGEEIESLPYEASGLRFTLGASYIWKWY